MLSQCFSGGQKKVFCIKIKFKSSFVWILHVFESIQSTWLSQIFFCSEFCWLLWSYWTASSLWHVSYFWSFSWFPVVNPTIISCENKRQEQVAETNPFRFNILFLFTLTPFSRSEMVHYFLTELTLALWAKLVEK